MSSITWGGTAGDWSVGSLWIGGHVPGTADIAVFGSTTPYLVTIGTSATNAEFETVAGVVLNDPSAVLSIGSLGTLGVGGTIDFEAGTLALAGTVSGATLVGDGGTLFSAGGTLLNDSITHTVSLATSFFTPPLIIEGNLGFGGGGTLVNLGGTIDFAGSQTLQGGTLVDDSFFTSTLDALGSLTFGSGFQFVAEGSTKLIGSFTNNGTITASELYSFNGVEVSFSNVLTVSGSSFVNNGSIILVDDVLDITGGTTGQLRNLIAGVNTNQGGQIQAVGTIDNRTATIDERLFGALHGVGFGGAAVLGGTLLTDASSVLPTTLIGVNVVGPIAGFIYGINIVGSLSVTTPAGGPGQIVLGTDEYQTGSSLNFSGSQTLDHAVVTLLPVSGGLAYNALIGDPAATLTLGPSLLVNSTETNPYGYGSQILGAVVINQGTLAAAAGDVLSIGAPSFVNSGTLVAGAGGEIILTNAVTAFSTPGAIELGAGATLALAGPVTLAEVTALASKVGPTGTLALLGSLDLGGGTLDLPGVNLLLGGTVAHGVIDAGNIVSFDGGILINATIDGAMTLGGGVVDIVGGLAFGGQGTIVAQGYGSGLASAGSLTLDNALLVVPPETSPYETGPGTFTLSSTSVTLGSGVTAEVSGALALVASTIANAAVITLAAATTTTSTTTSLALDAVTIVNTGQISIGAGDTLSLGSAAYSPTGNMLSLTNSGGISAATGATIQFLGTESTGQLQTLLSSFGSPGYTIDVLGTLLNTGTSFGPAIGDGGNTVSINGTVVGGTVQTSSAGGGTLTVLGAFFETVTVDGPLDVSGYFGVSGGLALDTASGAPGGSLTFTGVNGDLNLDDPAPTLDQATILLTNTGEGVNFGTMLSFGPALLLESDSAGDYIHGQYERISTLVNAGSIVVGSGDLTLGVNTLVNSGFVSVGAGDLLSIIGGFPGGPFSLVENGGSFHFGTGATLALAGNVSAATVATMLAGSTGVTLDLNGVLVNTGSVLAIGGGTIAAAVLAGNVVGGTITGTPLSVSGELDGVTYDGTLTIGTGGLSVADGLTVNNAAGGPGGLILVPYAAGGFYSAQPVLTLLDAETLDNAQMMVLANGFAINDSAAPITFGSHFTLSADIAGPTVTAPTITNAGTIIVAAGAGLDLHSDTIINTGSILVGAGGVLGLDVGYGTGAALSVTPGSISIAAGGTFEIGGLLNTGSLTSLVQVAAVPGVVVDLTGDVTNTGTTLIASGLFSTLELAGEIDGGTLVLPTGSAVVAGAAILEDVAVIGPVTLSATGASLLLHDGSTLRNTSGGAGLIIDSGNNTALSAGNVISGLGTPAAIDNVVIEVTGTADTLSFGLGPLATLDVLGVATEASDPGSAGTILVQGTGAYLNLAQPSFANSGTILVSAGATLGLDAVISSTQSLVLNNTGSISIAAGSTIELGGVLTTAQLEAMLGSIAVPGVVVELVGTLVNTGTVLDLAAGTSLGNVILDGEIVGGTVINAGGLLGIGQATLFSGVIFDGTVPLGSGDTLTTVGGLTLNDAGGTNPGSIVVSGSNAALLSFDPDLTLDHAALTVDAGASLTLGAVTESIFEELTPGQASQIALGAGFSIGDAGTIDVLGTQFTDSGPIRVSGSHAALIADADFIGISGSLAVGAGGTLALFPSYLIGSYAFPAPSAFSATGGVTIAPGVSLVIGGETTTSGLLAMLTTLGQPGGDTLSLVGAIDNTGNTFAPVPGGILDTVSLGGTLVGGTLVPGDANFTYNDPELEGVTVAGSLALTQAGQVITIIDGLTLATPGGGPGTIDLLGSYSDIIQIEDSETLDNLVVNVAGGVTDYYDASQELVDYATVTLGSGVTINDGGLLTLGGGVLHSGATIHVGTSAGLILQGSSILNSGSIAVAAGGTLELSFPFSNSSVANSFTDSGHLSLAAGSTLVIGGVNTTAQLLAELASISNPGVIVEVSGSLINSGTVLQPVAGGLLSNVILDADVVGGTIADGSGSLSILGGELDGVTYQGPLTFSGSNNYLYAAHGLTLEGTGGTGPGTLAVTGSNDILDFLNQATLDNAILQVGTSAFSVTTSNNLPLTLGSGLSVSIASSLLLSGNGIVENAPLSLTVPGGTLALSSNSIAITAPITVGASAALALGTGSSVYGTTPAPLAVTGLNDVILAAGATLAIGAVETPGQIATLASGLTNGLLDLFGTVLNTGSVLAVGAAGPFAHVAFSGLVEGGTVTAAVGSASFVQASTFDNVVFSGPLNLGSSIGASVSLTGTTSLVAIGGASENINATGTEQSVLFAPLLTETLDNTQISLGSPPGQAQAFYADSVEVASGTLALGAATTLSVTGVGVIEAIGGVTNTSLVNRGLITVSQGDLDFDTESGYYYNDTGVGSVVNAGVIAAGSSGFLDFRGNFTNSGTIALSQSAKAFFDTAPSGDGTISFAGGQEEVDLAAPGLFTATFQNFAGGNTLDFSDLPFAGSAVSSSFTNGTLTVLSGTVAVAEILMTGSIAYAAGDFTPTQDLEGNTEIVSTAPCFVAGTRLRTRSGEVAVENLTVGELVLTRSGRAVPIVWIGQRRVDVRRHPNPAMVQPVRIRAGAFADGVPQRDLLLSPDHAIWVDGVLIPAYALVNGATILREDVDHAHYFHVELPAHDVVYAEGLATESYLDTGNRGQFAGATTALHPNFAPLNWDNACAPLCLIGPEVVRAKQALLDRAQALGHVRHAASLRVSGGVEVPGDGTTRRFLLPPGVRRVSLTSDAGVPAELSAASTDRRRLGVAIGAVLLDGRLLRLDGPGFWPAEGGRRWTDGAAALELPWSMKPRVLDVQVVDVMETWAPSVLERTRQHG